MSLQHVDDTGSRIKFWGVSPDGQIINELEFVGEVAWRVSAVGELVVSEPTGRGNNDFLGEKVTVFGPAIGAANTRTLRGKWSLCGDGRHAFERRREGDGELCEVIDLHSGEVAGRVLLAGGNVGQQALSPDATLLAVKEFAATLDASSGVNVYDVATGKLTYRISATKTDGKVRTEIESPEFEASANVLKIRSLTEEIPRREESTAQWNSHRVRLDGRQSAESPAIIELGAAVPWFQPRIGLPDLGPERPFGIGGAVVDENGEGDRIWTLMARDGERFYWCIEGLNEAIAPWKEYPWSTMRFPPAKPAMAFVPTRSELCSAVFEPPLIDNLPTFVKSFVPKDSDVRKSLLQVRWHDWKSGVWRWVGSMSYPGPDPGSYPYRATNISGVQVQANAVLILFHEDRHLILQSWPLPPRDPKWPALGVAALCAAATWWVCARRYRRRTRLASVGAA